MRNGLFSAITTVATQLLKAGRCLRAPAWILLGAGCAAEQTGRSQPGEPGGELEPAYAMVTLVWTDDEPTGYVALTKSLDMEDLSLENARDGSNNIEQTLVYELDQNGHATRRFAAPGSATQWVRIR